MMGVITNHMIIWIVFKGTYGLISVRQEFLSRRDALETVSDIVPYGYDIVLGID